MERNKEFDALMNCPLPDALDGSVQRARAKYRKSSVGRWCGIPLASLAGVAAAFVLLVNTSIPFARACGNIPFLKDLASAVALSPSLKAAVEHDYVQPIGQSQTVNGITMAVEYLIVDQKQVNIFYTLKSDLYPALDGNPDFRNTDGTGVQALISWGHIRDESLQTITIDYTDRDVPDALTLNFSAWPVANADHTGEAPVQTSADNQDQEYQEPEAAAQFSFSLRLDPTFTEQGEVITMGQSFLLDGQTLTVETVEIYPTHLRLNLADHPDNTAWLKGLSFYLEDEKGNRYEKITNGVSATGGIGTPFFPTHRLESSYFGGAEHLTIHITGAEWLDKGSEYINLDIAAGTADHLPQGVTLGKAERRGNNVDVVLVAENRIGGGSYSILYDGWLDGDGVHHNVNHVRASGTLDKGYEHDGVFVPAGSFYEMFTLEDCRWDNVKLSVSFSRRSTFDTPVKIFVK